MSWKDSDSIVRMLYLVCVLSLFWGQTCVGESLPSLKQTENVSRLPSSVPFDHGNFQHRLRGKCQVGKSLLECYVQISRIDPALKRDFMHELSNVCPSSMNRFRCFYDYLNKVLHAKDDQSGNGIDKRNRRPSYMLCPETMETITCFDNYMVFWLNMVTSKEGKRTFGPGKRSSGDSSNLSKYNLINLMAKAREHGFSGSIDFLMRECVQADDIDECQRNKMRELAESLKMAAMTSKRNVASVCHDRDPIVCFEHYMVQLARYESGKQKVKGFVG